MTQWIKNYIYLKFWILICFLYVEKTQQIYTLKLFCLKTLTSPDVLFDTWLYSSEYCHLFLLLHSHDVGCWDLVKNNKKKILTTKPNILNKMNRMYYFICNNNENLQFTWELQLQYILQLFLHWGVVLLQPFVVEPPLVSTPVREIPDIYLSIICFIPYDFQIVCMDPNLSSHLFSIMKDV